MTWVCVACGHVAFNDRDMPPDLSGCCTSPLLVPVLEEESDASRPGRRDASEQGPRPDAGGDHEDRVAYAISAWGGLVALLCWDGPGPPETVAWVPPNSARRARGPLPMPASGVAPFWGGRLPFLLGVAPFTRAPGAS